MKIKCITVTAGRTFNHPHEQYSNLRPEVTMTATLDDGEDAAEAAKQLQQRAEGLVEDHKQGLLKSLEELYSLTTKQAEMRGLQRQLADAQSRLDEIRKEHPQLTLEN
jgi:predicted KAP-like P-loop ATPase